MNANSIPHITSTCNSVNSDVSYFIDIAYLHHYGNEVQNIVGLFTSPVACQDSPCHSKFLLCLLSQH